MRARYLTVCIFLCVRYSVLGAFKRGLHSNEVKSEVGTAEEGQFRFLVLIVASNQKPSHCTGSIISTTWVLTAAHCVARKNSSAENYMIYAGNSSYSLVKPKSDQALKVKILLANPDYVSFNASKTERGEHEDIGLLKTESEFQFNYKVDKGAISIFQPPYGQQENCITVGFHLKDSEIKIVYRDVLALYECGIVPNVQFAVLYQKNVFACTYVAQKDFDDTYYAGSPMICNDVILGVYSWRKPVKVTFMNGSRQHWVALQTKTFSYISWINYFVDDMIVCRDEGNCYYGTRDRKRFARTYFEREGTNYEYAPSPISQIKHRVLYH